MGCSGVCELIGTRTMENPFCMGTQSQFQRRERTGLALEGATAGAQGVPEEQVRLPLLVPERTASPVCWSDVSRKHLTRRCRATWATTTWACPIRKRKHRRACPDG